jgi:hypothetical protein
MHDGPCKEGAKIGGGSVAVRPVGHCVGLQVRAASLDNTSGGLGAFVAATISCAPGRGTANTRRE